jgi:peroxiredoxin
MTLLEPGDRFPFLTLTTTQGELSLPEALAGDFGVVLLNRGAWCPYCAAQLRSFQHALPPLTETGARVVAVWTEDRATTEAFVATNKIDFPVAYAADARALAAATGAFVNPEPLYVQSTGFVLGPDGKVLISVYSSGAIGRLVPEDVIGLIKYRQSAHR